MNKKKIIRASTIGLSLDIFCRGMLSELTERGYEVVALSTQDHELEELGRREGVRTIGVSISRRISLRDDVLSLIRLVRVFAHEKPDMVHSMTPKAGLLCMMAAWLTRVPVRVHTFTGLVWPTSKGLSRQILRLTDRLTCACATHVIPEGQGVLCDLRNGGITRKEMHVLGYGNVRGVDMQHYSRRPEVLAKAEAIRQHDAAGVVAGASLFRFVFVGRIVGDKGINELVEAFVKLQQSAPHGVALRLSLVGFYESEYDPVSAETRRLIDTTPEIENVGMQTGDDLLAWYAASDCFVFPSYREGFPNTVLEAGAMSLPAIVTDINGSREIVVPYKADQPQSAGTATGLIIPSHDAGALHDAMLWMLTHAYERRQMAAHVRPLIEAHFEQSYVRRCLYEYYDTILK